MKLNKRLYSTILFKLGTALVLLATLIVGLPVSPAKAYTGGYGLNFGGDGALLRLDQSGIMGPDPQCRNTLSVSLWVRPTGAPQIEGDPGRLPVIFTNVVNWVGISRGASVPFGGFNDSIWIWAVDTDFHWSTVEIPFTVGEWTHIALVHSGGRLKGYKDGILVGDVPAGTMGGQICGRVGIGAYFESFQGAPPYSITQEFSGQIDEVAIFQAELTEAEIREYMYREIDASHPKWGQIGAYYKMSNGSGTTVTDNATGSYPGELFGPVSWVASGAHAGPRTALAFDGVDEYVNVADHANLDLTGALSFEAWVNPDNWNNNVNTPFAVKGDASATPAVNYYFGKSSTNRMMFSYYSGSSRVDVVDTSGATYTNGNWYHLACTVDVTNNRPLTLARFLSSGDSAFQGKLDEVRLWSSERSLVQIRENMFQTLKGDEGNLKAYYRFDMLNSPTQTTAWEMTNAHLNGALQNMEPSADWVASTPFNTWVGTDSTTWAAEGNWSQNVIPGATEKVGVYGLAGGNNPALSAPVTVADMVVGSTGALSVGSGGSLSVSGHLFNNGLLAQTQTVSGSSDVGFFNTGNYGGLLLNPNGDNLGDTTVVIRGSQDCSNPPGDTVQRCFDIAPRANNTGIGKRITFFFDQSEESGNTCTGIKAYHFVGSATWDELTLDTSYGTGGRLCGADPRSVRVTGVTAFSPFALNLLAPTAIELISFSGTSRSGNIILVTTLVFALALLGAVLWLRRRQGAR